MLIKASRFYGIGLTLVTIGAIAACSSDPEELPGGSAGSTSHAGTLGTAGTTVTGTGGTPATGTAGTPATGTAGTAVTTAGTSAGGASSTACAGMKPASNLITQFDDLVASTTSAGQFTFMAGVPGGTFAYQPAVFTVTDAAKSLNVKGNVKNFDGFGVYTNACMDASAFTGVSFNVKGNAGPSGMLTFKVQTNATTAVDTVNKKGTCVVPAGTADAWPLCHPSQFLVPVTAGGAVVEVKFSQLTMGVPVAAVDGKDIVGLEWAFAWAGDTDTAYDVDVTLDDIKFTGGTTGGTGAGGSASGGSAGSGGAAAGSGGAAAGTGGAAAGTGGNGGSGGN
jgi:hypothetical protein